MFNLKRIEAPSLLAAALTEASHPKDFRRLYARPEGDGWRSLAEVISDEPGLNAWVEASIQRYKGRRDVAGAMMSLRLAGPVVDLAVSLYILKGWAVPLPADGLFLSFSENGTATGVALRDPWIVFGSSATAERGASAATERELASMPASHADLGGQIAARKYLAEQLAAVLQPALQAIKARTTYGLRGMWGQVVDQIAGIAARRGRLLDLDQRRTWQLATELIDALAAVQPLVRMRPYPFFSPWPAGEATVAVKGSCCLFFKTHDDKGDQRYCANCPLLPDESRTPRVAKMLLREYERLRGIESPS